MTPYYERDGITIYCEDCLRIMPQLEPPFDVVITDPPYLLEDTEVPIRGRGVTNRVLESITIGLPWEYSLSWVSLCAKLAQQWIVFCNYKMIGELHVEIEKFAKVFNIFVWNKPNAPRMTRPVPRFDCEFIIWAKKAGETCRRMGEFDTSLLCVPMAQAGCFAVERVLQKDNKKAAHPTQKPIATIMPFVQRLTDKGHIILDPFMGSGTTLVAAQTEGRRCTGIELSEEYCRIAVDRLRQPSFFSIPSNGKVKSEAKQLEIDIK